MPTLCLTCLVYTLENKPVEENKYIDMFTMFTSQLLKSGGLQKEDAFVLIADERTFKYITTNPYFSTMKTLFPFQFNVVIVPSPKTYLEGMMRRYTIFSFTQDIYMYCDIDIYIRKSLHNLTKNMTLDTICICQEGSISDSNYNADLPKDFIINPDMPGFSSGKFTIWGKNLLESFF